MAKLTPWSPPSNWQQILQNIKTMRTMHLAPVDTMGCSKAHETKDSPVDQRFQILMSLMISSQTKDEVTWAAVQRLKEKGFGRAAALAEAEEKDLEDLIKPAGFYRRKAVYLKRTASKLNCDYDGDIPNTIEELCKLPGVGPKMAHLAMQEAWSINSGIGVDTHVHRISQWLHWVPKTVKKEDDTRVVLESWLPKEHWTDINKLLVGFGQTICKAVAPKCNECLNNDICPSSQVLKKKTTKRKPPKPKDSSESPPKRLKPSISASSHVPKK